MEVCKLANIKEVEKFFAMDSDELFIQIGYALESDGLGLDEMDDDEAQDLGHTWIEGNKPKFREILCKLDVIQSISSSSSSSDIMVAAAVADYIIGLCSGGVPPIAVACLLVKAGIDKLCQDIKLS
jgi:hypothetical protein